jgi:hypothetical protein
MLGWFGFDRKSGAGAPHSILVFGGVDADVVDEHGLGIGGGGVRWAGPIAADGYVEEQEVWVVEDPGTGGFGWRSRGC